MSSLKMTFSLASLVLLMAFIAMPVMAHETSNYDENHDGLNDAGNPLVGAPLAVETRLRYAMSPADSEEH